MNDNILLFSFVVIIQIKAFKMVVVQKGEVFVFVKEIKEKLDYETPHKESLKAMSMLPHKNSALGGVVGQFKCDPCDKTFRTANNLKNHELTKHQMRRFQCMYTV